MIGGSGADTITLTTLISKGSIDLGLGTDKLVLGDSRPTWPRSRTSRRSPAARATIPSRSARRSPATDSIDLGSGSDKLTLGDFTNTGSVTNVETLIGGTGADTITFTTQLSNGSIDLGAGNDSLTLGTSPTRRRSSNVESLTRRLGADTITFGAAVSNGSIDLGSGSDMLTLGNFVNVATVSERRDAHRRRSGRHA